MWLLRPRVRTDGLYVGRNTYIRTGIAEWEISNPVHLVCYYPYMRLFPFGRFLYKNSSQKLKDVAKYMNFRGARADCVFSSHYTLSDDKVKSGVNNNEVSSPDEDILGVVEAWQDDETRNPDVPAVLHKRGLTPFVFVPFEEVETSFLNLPVEKMDYFVPG